MDDADRADSRIQQIIDDGMARARRQIERSLPITGVCHYCGQDIRGRLFCSKECSTDYEHEQKRRKEMGL